MIRKLLYGIVVFGILLEISGIAFLLLGSFRHTTNTIVAVSPTVVPPKIVVSPTVGVVDVTLVKDKPIVVPNTNITLQLTQTAQPNPKCPDCGSATTIQASSSANAKTLVFSCGGLTGCTLEQEIEKYVVSITKQIDQNTIVVQVKPKQ